MLYGRNMVSLENQKTHEGEFEGRKEQEIK